MVNKITGIILSGGKSSRMGTEKGLVKLNGKFLIQHVIDVVKKVTDDILIIANNTEYSRFGYKTFEDIHKDCGPMGGIYTGLIYTNTKKNLILSCDIPFVSKELLQYLIKNSDNCDVVVPIHDGRLEPLCSIYYKNCIEKFHELLMNKAFKIVLALTDFNTKEIDVSKQPFYSEQLLKNINAKEELHI